MSTEDKKEKNYLKECSFLQEAENSGYTFSLYGILTFLFDFREVDFPALII